MESAKHNGDKNGALKDEEAKQVDFSKRLSIYSLNNLDMVSFTHIRIRLPFIGFYDISIFYIVILIMSSININERHKNA